MDKALIFGVNSQDGFYLSQICIENGIECVGVSRSKGNWIEGDISDYKFVESIIKAHKPTYIFHIAANSTTRHEVLFENYSAISTGTLIVLEVVRLWHPSAKVFVTGSGVQFENNGRPIKETDSFNASSAYAVARIQSVYAARYFRNLGIQVYVGYLFHHESPLRKPQHVSKKIVDAIKRIKSGSIELIELGDISVKKEWTYAKDVAEGIFTLLSQSNVFEATIGSGKAYTIQEWLEVCFGMINIDWKNHVRLKGNFLPEYQLLVSDPNTINALGWRPKHSFYNLAELMMYYG